jgi:PadR family transcriptional regulator, regulatory protein AphA
MQLGKTAYVILGMLRLGQRTGYEIKSYVDCSTRFFWAASYGQIYPELRRLEDAGLVVGEEDPRGGRQRRAYSLTAEGERVLHDWITADVPLHVEMRHEGLLRLFFGDAVAPSARAELARTIRDQHARVRDELRALQPAAERGREAPLRVLEFGIAYQDFVIEWCERLERELLGEPAATGG